VVSQSGNEFLKQVKKQITELDPAQVMQLLGQNVVIVDCREIEELALFTFRAVI